MIIIKLYELMWKQKIKGYELAEKTNLSPATISKIVQGKNMDIKLSTIDKLCKFFNCEIKDILEYTKN